MTQIRLYLMGEKGLEVLEGLVARYGSNIIECVIADQDKAVLNDYYEEIKSCCLKNKINLYDRKKSLRFTGGYAFAIGWRYIISSEKDLIVFHDSLLPKHRGFNPLVTALINGDEKVGVTALFASDKYDCGDIIEQRDVKIAYPIKISDAIKIVKTLYSDLAYSIVERIMSNSIILAHKQDDRLSTYSLWRDEEDYLIDWSWDSEKIERFVDAVGFPYQGAQAYVDGVKVIINKVMSLPDLIIENRVCGKVIMIESNYPVIVCGKGLLQVIDAIYFDSKAPALPLQKFRVRFKNCN